MTAVQTPGYRFADNELRYFEDAKIDAVLSRYNGASQFWTDITGRCAIVISPIHLQYIKLWYRLAIEYFNPDHNHVIWVPMDVEEKYGMERGIVVRDIYMDREIFWTVLQKLTAGDRA